MSVRLVSSRLPPAGLTALATAPPNTRAPKDYEVLFRALAHRKFTDAYRPSPRPVVALPSTLTHRDGPRTLYAEMLKHCFPHGANLVSKKSKSTAAEKLLEAETLLTTALLAFTRLEDYVAAIIALRVLDAFEIPITERTRTAALHAIAVRVAEAPGGEFARCIFPDDGVAFQRWKDEAAAAGWGAHNRRMRIKAGKLREGGEEDMEIRNKATESAMARLLEAHTTTSDKPSRPLENILRTACRGRGLVQSPTGKPWTRLEPSIYFRTIFESGRNCPTEGISESRAGFEPSHGQSSP